MMRRLIGVAAIMVSGLVLLSSAAKAQQALATKVLAERKVLQVPDGPLFWRIETAPSLAQAQAVAGLWGLAAESGGKVWLFRLGPRSGSSGGGSKIAEIGPLPQVVAPEYLLRINEATGPSGSITPVHSHPGSEAFYVVRGQQTVRLSGRAIQIAPGQAEAGPGGGTALQVSSSGGTDLLALVMFVVDATKPFSSPATFP